MQDVPSWSVIFQARLSSWQCAAAITRVALQAWLHPLYGHLARSLAPWRNAAAPLDGASSEASRALRHDAPAPPRLPALDPMTGRQISH